MCGLLFWLVMKFLFQKLIVMAYRNNAKNIQTLIKYLRQTQQDTKLQK